MKIAFAALLLLLAGPPARSTERPASEAAALDAATAALCNRKIAVLGEAEHGDARTETFKVKLIERLVSQCGYSAVIFEASFYEFVQLDRNRRAGQPITSAMVATAVGGLWKYDREIQPLLSYLARHASAGSIRLGGFDFQQGGREQDFSNLGVIAELTAELRPERRDFCRAQFRDQLFNGRAAARRGDIAGCLAEMAALPPSVNRSVRRERREMLANLAAFAAADPAELNHYIASRDREMFANFERWMARWPAGTKVILWTATAHAARAPHRHKGFEGVQPFGAYLARRYGKRMFALGFGAQGGTTRGRPQPRVIASLAPDALEAWAGPIAPGGAIYLDRRTLARAGSRPAGLFNHQPVSADWSLLLDAVVVFPLEAAAADIRTGG
ncbi:MAG: erythromycin esterase family protein [Novosphingobium sp.]|uniref:erythromycin esterase family protein n=1 Tax=Novosphingobium sp. TaxID=1874826 RepID=UPI0032BA56D5